MSKEHLFYSIIQPHIMALLKQQFSINLLFYEINALLVITSFNNTSHDAEIWNSGNKKFHSRVE